MRNGKLLAEEPPSNLIDKCRCDNLEEVFLELSKRQDAHEETNVSLIALKNLLRHIFG